MATQSPFSWLADSVHATLRNVAPPPPPPWVIHEVQQRGVLFMNHVLMQEPAAQERLRRQRGRVVAVSWRDVQLRCTFTPAGLIEWVDSTGTPPDLTLTVQDVAPLELVQTVLQGQKPAVRIEGDVQLAAEINWLIDHVRWEPEEDLARLIGDVPAHSLVELGRRSVEALRRFVQKRADA